MNLIMNLFNEFSKLFRRKSLSCVYTRHNSIGMLYKTPETDRFKRTNHLYWNWIQNSWTQKSDQADQQIYCKNILIDGNTKLYTPENVRPVLNIFNLNILTQAQ